MVAVVACHTMFTAVKLLTCAIVLTQHVSFFPSFVAQCDLSQKEASVQLRTLFTDSLNLYSFM